ncbi:SDR family oxidoreductase [Streptomyces sp. NPDC093510]|uniref:SDR family oxidoreductase n=1 Tax=Streptomyces sp. NPDC093510 TaxID=3155199 RepID=UPI00343EE6EC
MDYAASKAALITFIKSIASHLARRGVRANVVAPGPTWTVTPGGTCLCTENSGVGSVAPWCCRGASSPRPFC